MHKLVKRSQLKEWVEQPVVEIVVQALGATLQEAKDEKADAFFPGDAHKTQEYRAGFVGAIEILENMISFLKYEKQSVDALFEAAEIQIVDDEEFHEE